MILPKVVQDKGYPRLLSNLSINLQMPILSTYAFLADLCHSREIEDLLYQ